MEGKSEIVHAHGYIEISSAMRVKVLLIIQRECSGCENENKLQNNHDIETPGRREHFHAFKSAAFVGTRTYSWSEHLRRMDPLFDIRTRYPGKFKVAIIGSGDLVGSVVFHPRGINVGILNEESFPELGRIYTSCHEREITV
jgi:hypothetical protein